MQWVVMVDVAAVTSQPALLAVVVAMQAAVVVVGD